MREENERKWKAEMDAKQEEVRLRLQREQRMARIQKGQELSVPFYADEEESEEIMSTSRRLPPKIPMPKYDDNVKDVSRYLELFEKVAKQNGYPQSSWSLAFRAAVAGTKLETIASLGESFDDIKKEVLLAHGYTAEQLWKQLTTIKQGDESFRQMFWRATTKLGQFFKLAVKHENVTAELMTGTLIKYMVLEGCSNELRAHFLEKTLSSITCDEFQEIGSSFQEAHGRSQCSEKGVHSFASCSVEQSSTVNAWKVSAESTLAKLEKLPVSERRNFVFENHLCFNCLLPGHIGSMCRSAKRCAKCKLKHNTLLHADYRNKEGEHTKVNMVSSQVDHTEAGKKFDVLLMTAIVHVMDNKKQRHKVRAFFDPGAQASFVSAKLVRQVSAQKLRNTRVTIQGFGSTQESSVVGIFQLDLIDRLGTRHEMTALEKNDLNLNIPPVSPVVIERWRNRGVELSENELHDDSLGIELMIGADYINKFLIEKKVVDGEAAWLSNFGWVLSGPTNIASSSNSKEKCETETVRVAFVKNCIESLWEMEEPFGKKVIPAFPLKKDIDDNRYEVGLLWRGESRPQDNKKQAVSQAIALRKRLVKENTLDAYEKVLLEEYLELGAIERDSSPEEGYYMPHHVVVRSSASTTKLRAVFNASASIKNKRSLNDHLDSGPSLLPDLTGLLLRFREFKYAFQVDIKKAFFMIAVRPEDRVYLRFVWPNQDGEVVTWRLKRVPFGVNCSPFLLNATIRHHLQLEKQNSASEEVRKIVELMQDSFYVDDCLSSLSVREQVDEFKLQVAK